MNIVDLTGLGGMALLTWLADKTSLSVEDRRVIIDELGTWNYRRGYGGQR
jgi:hypothetical protein